jgi:glyoxylase-like metal-dependent hydrolase (beta-lactamase superfamily II)
MGIDPSRIEQIVMTHIHWDHTAGMHLFPQARFYIQAEDFRGLLSLNPNEETYYCPGHWLPQLPQIELLEGDYQLKPGIRLIFTGGHTKGHQIVEVTTRQGTILLGGDSPFNYDLLWSIIPASDWQAFRQVTGGRFYWDENVMPSVRSWLYDNNHLYQGNHHVLSLEEIKRLGRLITSHNPHLLNVKSIP